jgi:hypothetical protein
MRVFVLDKNLKPLDPCDRQGQENYCKKGGQKYSIVIHSLLLYRIEQLKIRLPILIESRSLLVVKPRLIAVVQEETGRVTNALEISHARTAN